MYVYVPVQSHYDYANLPNVHVNYANAFNAFNEPSISFGPPSISFGVPSIRYAPLQVQVRPPVPPVTLSSNSTTFGFGRTYSSTQAEAEAEDGSTSSAIFASRQGQTAETIMQRRLHHAGHFRWQ